MNRPIPGAPDDPDSADAPEQKLIDQLQIMLPLIQRLKATARQQLQDADTAQTAAEKAVAILAITLRTRREQQEARARLEQSRQQQELDHQARLRGEWVPPRFATSEAPLIKPRGTGEKGGA